MNTEIIITEPDVTISDEHEEGKTNFRDENLLTVTSTVSTSSGHRNLIMDQNTLTKIIPNTTDYYKNKTLPIEKKNLTKKCGLSFVDFMPIFKRKNEGWFFQAGYEAFSDLLDRLNHWLHCNPKWGVRYIETVYYDSGSQFNRKDAYIKKGKFHYELRGLRMWVSPKKQETAIQKIACIITIPKLKLNGATTDDQIEGPQITTDRTLGASNFENLTELIARLNHNLQTEPIQGNIISMECVNIPILNYEIDVEKVYYADNTYSDCDKLQLVKIYYEIGNKNYNQKIGFVDFRPKDDNFDITSPYTSPQLSNFSSLLENANQYFKQNTDQHFLNAQTLKIPFTKYVNNKEQRVSCQEMFYAIDTSSKLKLKFLRLFYTTHSHRRFHVSEHNVFDLNSELFLPKYIEPKNGGHGFDHHECFQTMRERINYWLTSTGVRIVSMETLINFTNTNLEDAIENCLRNSEVNEKMNYFIAFRIYYVGSKVVFDHKAYFKQMESEIHDRQCTII